MLALVFVLSIALWWWFRPISVEEPWGNGDLTMQYRIRRSWNGERRYVGPATLRYENGNIAVLSNVDGIEWKSIDPTADSYQARYWHEDGRELNFTEWFFYMSTDYFPRRMNGEPINTEQEWRHSAIEFEKQHPELANKVSQ
jgi:hypothetical protein